MPSMVRFEHGFIPELNLFKITSPDVKGLHITAPTQAEAEREALAMVALIHARQQGAAEQKLKSVTFEAA